MCFYSGTVQFTHFQIRPQIIEGDTTSLLAILTRYTVGALFIFRESYVQLITSQHWSFISSVLTPNQSSTWFAPISGLTSITSALAAMGVGKLSAVWGLQGVLGVAAVVLGGSVVFGEAAYGIAEKNGFNPADEHKKKHGKSSSSKTNNDESLITKARDVFTRVPTLWALFCEILACQGLSTVLNVLTVPRCRRLFRMILRGQVGWVIAKHAMERNADANVGYDLLRIRSKVEWRHKWRPFIEFDCIRLLGNEDLEFSVRRMLDEMVYVPLDFESRFLGKEVIGVLDIDLASQLPPLHYLR
ncbi:putative ADP/ATP carrier protein [Skeletonema marinoi]|uniref:ADP/ATP carrier protein n=1 Tax=Skeletonema marinoi TaxID=267567 RepID=A0AAD8YHP0_9STRA|nr:putative ADP/ATP carrier protein [Skeletonema marinoi]